VRKKQKQNKTKQKTKQESILNPAFFGWLPLTAAHLKSCLGM